MFILVFIYGRIIFCTNLAKYSHILIENINYDCLNPDYSLDQVKVGYLNLKFDLNKNTGIYYKLSNKAIIINNFESSCLIEGYDKKENELLSSDTMPRDERSFVCEFSRNKDVSLTFSFEYEMPCVIRSFNSTEVKIYSLENDNKAMSRKNTLSIAFSVSPNTKICLSKVNGLYVLTTEDPNIILKCLSDFKDNIRQDACRLVMTRKIEFPIDSDVVIGFGAINFDNILLETFN
ncbi:putative SP-containing protein [Vairimorpha necatrix]|uniref:SP-containing protein n=1 Tax=Vairimorpha necatrix TaxID=6039 RepID=A0AAX4J8R5_9MICR